jgi:hypothetical protein
MRRALLALAVALLMAVVPLQAVITIVAEGGIAATSAAATTTGTLNTTGATGLVVTTSWYCGGGAASSIALTDNQSNTYTLLGSRVDSAASGCLVVGYDVTTPTVSATHTFTATGVGGDAYAAVCIIAFAGGNTYDVRTGGQDTGATTSLNQLASVTPSANGALLVTSVVTTGTAHMINSSFTGGFQANYNVGVSQGGGCARLIQTTAAAVNPTWSWTTASTAAVDVSVFSAASVPTGGKSRSGRFFFGVGR